jgi:hypothetical protein
MTVVSVTTFPVQTGGDWEAVLAGQRQGKAILEKHGARNVRLLVSLVGAEPVGTMHLTMEADSNADLGRITDAVFTDPEMLTLMNSGGPQNSWSTSVYFDQPL